MKDFLYLIITVYIIFSLTRMYDLKEKIDKLLKNNKKDRDNISNLKHKLNRIFKNKITIFQQTQIFNKNKILLNRTIIKTELTKNYPYTEKIERIYSYNKKNELVKEEIFEYMPNKILVRFTMYERNYNNTLELYKYKILDEENLIEYQYRLNERHLKNNGLLEEYVKIVSKNNTKIHYTEDYIIGYPSYSEYTEKFFNGQIIEVIQFSNTYIYGKYKETMSYNEKKIIIEKKTFDFDEDINNFSSEPYIIVNYIYDKNNKLLEKKRNLVLENHINLKYYYNPTNASEFIEILDYISNKIDITKRDYAFLSILPYQIEFNISKCKIKVDYEENDITIWIDKNIIV